MSTQPPGLPGLFGPNGDIGPRGENGAKGDDGLPGIPLSNLRVHTVESNKQSTCLVEAAQI